MVGVAQVFLFAKNERDLRDEVGDEWRTSELVQCLFDRFDFAARKAAGSAGMVPLIELKADATEIFLAITEEGPCGDLAFEIRWSSSG